MPGEKLLTWCSIILLISLGVVVVSTGYESLFLKDNPGQGFFTAFFILPSFGSLSVLMSLIVLYKIALKKFIVQWSKGLSDMGKNA